MWLLLPGAVRVFGAARSSHARAPICECRDVQPRDPAALLDAEHAVARVLADRPELPHAYPQLLEAIGVALGWDVAAAWVVGDDGRLGCVASWRAHGVAAAAFVDAGARMRLARGEGLPGRVWGTGRRARTADLAADRTSPRGPAARRAGLHCGFAFPVRGTRGVIGAIELFAAGPRRADR